MYVSVVFYWETSLSHILSDALFEIRRRRRVRKDLTATRELARSSGLDAQRMARLIARTQPFDFVQSAPSECIAPNLGQGGEVY